MKTLILALCFVTTHAHANVLYRPKNIAEVDVLETTKKFPLVFVPGSKIVWANTELMRADFPELRDLSDAQIHRWIIGEFSYIAKAQLRMGELRNSRIPVENGREVIGFRQHSQARGGNPLGWRPFQGRGHLAEAWLGHRHIGLVDLKGSGVTIDGAELNHRLLKFYERHGKTVDDFRLRNSTNGLMHLESAMLQVAGSEVVERIFRARPTPLASGTIRNYFILEFPFNVKLADGRETPAVLMARQAHVGRLWVGTNPLREFSNIKQTDFFGAYTDADTIRISIPGMGPTYDRSIGRVGDLALTFEPEVLSAHAKGDPNAVANYLNGIIARAEKALGLTPIIEQENRELGFDEALKTLARWIEKDPARYWRHAETFLRLPKHLLDNPQIHSAIRALLKFDWEQKEATEISDSPGARSPRELGVALAHLLPEKPALSARDLEFIATRGCQSILSE